MNILSIKHRGLRRFIEDDDPRELHPDLEKRTRNILTALLAAESVESVAGPLGWRSYQLSGTRAGTWSISVTGNWRITFEIEGSMVKNLDLEDFR
jgi:proteic killer suppression protein